MIIICGKTIAEVERDLEMAKRAIATGAPMGIGGATIADVEQAMRGLLSAVGESNPPISNPNYTAPCGRCCDCDCDPAYDDECEDCGYGCEDDEPPIVTALADMLRSLGVDEATIGKLMQSALGL
jgi:hypothetical protein